MNEEKKAIKELKEFAYNPNGWFSVGNAKKILNLIEKQQKEIKQLKEDISNMYDEKIVRNILEDECGLSKYEIDEILN